MKKSLFILVSVLMLSFLACSKTDDVKQSWVFTFTTVQSVNPAMTGYPFTTTMFMDLSDLTPSEADAVIKRISLTTSVSDNGHTFTSTIIGTKAVKK